jgi:hypothetical protein
MGSARSLPAVTAAMGGEGAGVQASLEGEPPASSLSFRSVPPLLPIFTLLVL